MSVIILVTQDYVATLAVVCCLVSSCPVIHNALKILCAPDSALNVKCILGQRTAWHGTVVFNLHALRCTVLLPASGRGRRLSAKYVDSVTSVFAQKFLICHTSQCSTVIDGSIATLYRKLWRRFEIGESVLISH